MGNFVKHTACSKCGSRDNAAVYDDGSIYCFSCREQLNKGTFAKLGMTSKLAPYTLPRLEPAPLQDRSISEDAGKLYRVGVDENFQALYFPYYDKGVCVAAKKRFIDNWEEKDYRWEGNGKTIGLFGMHTRTDNTRSSRRLIIVEGEFDALAAWQMYSTLYTVVSVAHGAGGAANDLRMHMEWVNSFTDVVLCFDNDAIGQQAVQECLELISPGKARVAMLPSEYKDANDMLKARATKEFVQAIDTAIKILPPDYINTSEELQEEVIKDSKDMGTNSPFPTPYTALNRAIGGLNPGELMTIAAYTGIGKTTFGLSLILNAIKQGRRVFLITLETRYTHVILKLLEMDTGIPFYSSQDHPEIEGEYREKLKHICDHLSVYSGLGELTLRKLEELVTYGAMAGTHDVVFIDHITAATQTATGNQVQAIDATMSMLNRVTTTHKLTTIVITHVSRNPNDTKRKDLSLSQIRNSEGISQYSHTVIGLVRDMEEQSGIITVKILKGHRRFGVVRDFDLRYNRSKCNYEELHDTQQEEGSSRRPSFSEALQILKQKKQEQGRESELQEPLRGEDTPRESEPDIRANNPNVSEDVQTGFRVDEPDGETDSHRGEGILSPGRPLETISGEEIKPPPTLATLVLQAQQRDKYYKEQGFINVLGMGRATRIYVG